MKASLIWQGIIYVSGIAFMILFPVVLQWCKKKKQNEVKPG